MDHGPRRADPNYPRAPVSLEFELRHFVSCLYQPIGLAYPPYPPFHSHQATPPMSSLLQTALTNRQAATAAQRASSPSPSSKLNRLSLASDDDDDVSSADEGDYADRFAAADADEDEDELVDLQTRPGTPVPGGPKSQGLTTSGKGHVVVKSRDPVSPPPRARVASLFQTLITGRQLRILPSALAVRVFLQLDIKSLARCNRVCKRWRKSSTLNYSTFPPLLHVAPTNPNPVRRASCVRREAWFLHCRSLTLLKPTAQQRLQPGDPDPDDPNSGYDPYAKHRGLPLLTTPVPASATPQWSKRESKKEWRPVFRDLATRKDTHLTPARDPLNVDVDALSASVSDAGGGSGYSTPATIEGPGSGAATPPVKSKKEMRAHYKSLGGRKSKAKGMLGGTPRGHRDLGGAGETEEDRFSSPF